MMLKKIGIMILKILGFIWFLICALVAVIIFTNDMNGLNWIGIIVLLAGMTGLIPMVRWRSKRAPRTQQRHIQSELVNLNNQANSLHDIIQSPSGNITFEVKANVPEEVYSQMRSTYTLDQVERDIEILTDCYTICSTSNNLETVISRMESGTRIAYTLLQAESAEIIDASLIRRKISYFRGNEDQILSQALWRNYTRELSEIKKLKTDNGKRNRVNKFIDDTESIVMPRVMNRDDGVIFNEALWEEWGRIKNLLQQV